MAEVDTDVEVMGFCDGLFGEAQWEPGYIASKTTWIQDPTCLTAILTQSLDPYMPWI